MKAEKILPIDGPASRDSAIIRLDVQMELIKENLSLLLVLLARKPVGMDSERVVLEVEIVQNMLERLSALHRDLKTYQEARKGV
jgi:hypothetical protein